jgi:hypothetical protein
MFAMSSILPAATIAVLIGLGQSDSQAFVGKWTCEYFGRTLARLDLQDANDCALARRGLLLGA